MLSNIGHGYKQNYIHMSTSVPKVKIYIHLRALIKSYYSYSQKKFFFFVCIENLKSN